MLALITILEDSLAPQQQEGGCATQAVAEHQMLATGPPGEAGLTAEVKAAPAKPMETEETTMGETPNDEEDMSKDVSAEELTPSQGGCSR